MPLLEEILCIKLMFQTSEDEKVIKGANGHSEVWWVWTKVVVVGNKSNNLLGLAQSHLGQADCQ